MRTRKFAEIYWPLKAAMLNALDFYASDVIWCLFVTRHSLRYSGFSCFFTRSIFSLQKNTGFSSTLGSYFFFGWTQDFWKVALFMWWKKLPLLCLSLPWTCLFTIISWFVHNFTSALYNGCKINFEGAFFHW